MTLASKYSASLNRMGPSGVKVLLGITIGLYIASCTVPETDKSATVARVENHSITRNELYNKSGINNISLGEITERWIDDQVLVHHARKSPFLDQRMLDQLVEEYRQRISAQLLLDSLVLRRTRVTPEGARDYYNDNLHEFQFSGDAAEVVLISFQQLDDAQEALRSLNTATTLSDSILSRYNYDHQIAYRYRLIPVLDEAIFSAPPGNLLGPLQSEYGYHLVQVVHHFSAGETIPRELVQTKLFHRLFQMELPLIRTTVLDSLREVTDVEIHSN